jgi:uncharacterized membrane protein
LIWAQVSGEFAARAMLLVFVVVVGIYGAASAKRSILFIQALPAAIALAPRVGQPLMTAQPARAMTAASWT